MADRLEQTAEEAGLVAGGRTRTGQNILDLPEDRRPELINDRGRQMKAKPIQRLCEDHGMPQLFARPRTPNDNPFIESAFSTVKRTPEYPGRFLDDGQAIAYFAKYFDWYNSEHYHSGIDYVTPLQAHTGLREKIVARRSASNELSASSAGLANQEILSSENSKPQPNPRHSCSVITRPLRSLTEKRSDANFQSEMRVNHIL